MKAKKLSRLLAMTLAVVMLVGMLPMTALAAAVDYDENDGDYYKVVSQKEWELAPGIVEAELIINNAAGDRRQVMHVVEVDMDNEYTRVIPSSKGMTPTPGQYGVQTMDKQAAYAEANGYGNVVAAMNISLSWYDSEYYDTHPELVGEPLGYLILDGVQYTNSNGKTSGAQTCLVINYDEKNGEARPADMPKVQIRATSEAITGWEEQVIPANFGFLVKDGKMVNSKENHTSEGASRSMLGIKADGTIVMVMNDGRQAPYSTGFNDYEMSEAMLKLGCVYAINGDGGGSSQFLSQRPGEELELHCSPSDGAPRATTHGVLAITTAPSNGEFVRAHVESESQYYTPGSTVVFEATGADLAGGAAEIPADATWQLSDDTMGTIEDGVFVSNGTEGTVAAQLVWNGKVVGSAEINVVVPDSIAFGGAEAYTVPFGETVTLNVTATYDVFDVALEADDYTITFANDTLGTLVGNKYTAGETGGKTNMTVTLNANTAVSKTVPLTIGKGSEVIFTFEEGTEGADLNNWVIKDHEGKNPTYMEMAIVTEDEGMVHNGETSLAVHMPSHTRINGGEGYTANSITWVGDRILLENATAIGLWVYIPEEATQTEIALNYVWYNDKGVQQRTTPDLCLNDSFNGNESSGWHYLSVPISKAEAYIEDAKDVAASQGFKRNFFLKFYITNSGNAGDEHSYMGDITYYIDDVTVDYSDAVADRIAPTFGSTSVTVIGNEVETALSAGTTAALNSGEVSFTATVSDNVSVDADSADVYVDGAAVSATCRNGRIISSDVSLNAGVHRVVFEAADTMGNVSRVVRYVEVAGDAAIRVVPRNPELETALTGSVYWMDVVAAEADKVEKITLKLDTDSMHAWELDQAELARGFEIDYGYASIADEKDNAVTIELTNNGSDVSGETVIASLPIRVWSYCGNEYGTEKTPAQAWTEGAITAVAVHVEVEQGEVVYEDGESATFSDDKVKVLTEAYVHKYKMDTTYFKNNTYHVHTAEAAEQEATCTQVGFTGRTVCTVCESPVEWGTTVPMADHTYDFVDGVLKCACGKLFNGVYTDGKTYVDGVTNADGWAGESYYLDGVLLTGVQLIDGKYYNFGEDGICPNGYPMSAEWWTNAEGENRYMNVGVPVTGYNMINGTPTNFYDNGIAFDGEIEISGEICVFEKGAFVESTTADVMLAGLIGPEAYFVLYTDGTLVISGEGATFDFVSVGTNFGPDNISWKNRPWGKNTQYSDGIKNVIVGKDITRIGDYVLGYTYNLASVTFEEGSKLESIGFAGIYYSRYLKELILPDTVKTLENMALSYNKNLVNVYIPQGMESMHSTVFNNSEKVVMNVAEGTYAETFAVKNNIPYTTREFVESVIAEGECGETAAWTLYASGTMVIDGTGAMDDYTNQKYQPWADYRSQIKHIIIGKDITHVGSYAFAHAYNVETITFEEDSVLESIGKTAFYYSLFVKDVILPETVTSLDWMALGYNSKLGNVYIPQGIDYMHAGTFTNSKNVVLDVAEGSYAENFAVKNEIPYTTREFVESVIAEGECGETAAWTLYASGTMVISGSGAMADYSNQKYQPWADYRGQIKHIVIGKDITHVGGYAFAHAYNVETITFEEGSVLESIGKTAFYYSLFVKEIILPETLTKLDWMSLGYNSKLVNVYIPQGVSYMHAGTFTNSNKIVLDVAERSYAETFAVNNGIAHTTREFIESVIAEGECGQVASWTLYESGTMVISGSGAMADYSNQKYQPWADYRSQIKHIVIGKDITRVGSYAFAHAYNVETITFEEGSQLDSIGKAAFYYALFVKEIILPETVTTLEWMSLGYNSKLVNVYVPEAVSSIHDTAFTNSNKIILNVVEGSYAETFAANKGLNYNAI